jgi:lipoyl(octanoyl) transferase
MDVSSVRLASEGTRGKDRRAPCNDLEVGVKILILRCGIVPYEGARAAQRRLEAARQEGTIPDALMLLEHPPVYTRGRRSGPEELPMGTEWYEMQGIEVRDTDRGGRVTYHGLGQLVAYPIVSLKPYGDDVHEYVRGLERVAIGALSDHGVLAGTREGLTGIWVGERKIGSIGVHVSRGITTHGMAINVNNDLQPFEWIVPCGIEDCRVTSVSRELGAEQDLEAFAETLAGHFADVYGREPVEADPAELGLRPASLVSPR